MPGGGFPVKYDDWFDCDTCAYATNSRLNADVHEDENPDHTMIVSYDEYDD